MVFADYHVASSLAVPGSIARGQEYRVQGTPTVWVDGRTRLTGSIDVVGRYTGAFDAAVADSALLALDVDLGYEPSASRAEILVQVQIAEDVPTFEDCVLRAVLVEDGVSTGNRTLDRTVRAVLEPRAMATGKAGAQETHTWSLSVPAAWQPGRLKAVAWVERRTPAEEKGILNAAQSDSISVTPARERSWGEIKVLWR